jgi:predicted enzyme related to lactoylglutathione lyase
MLFAQSESGRGSQPFTLGAADLPDRNQRIGSGRPVDSWKGEHQIPERHGYIPGVPCWVDVSEPDPEATLEFYGRLFGWEFEDVMPIGSEGGYFIGRGEGPGSSIFETSRELRSGDVAAVGTIPEAAPPTGMWNTYFWVDSADDAASRVRDAGGGIVVEPFDFMDACRMAIFTDPEGAAFRAWEAKEHKGARLVNDPGAVVFNNLNTRDVDAARSFYGSVFGWRTASIGGAGLTGGPCLATATGSSASTTRDSESRWRRPEPRMGSRTSSGASFLSRTTSPIRRRTGA